MATWGSPRQVAQNATGDGSGDNISNFMSRATFNINQTAGDEEISHSAQGVFTTLIKPLVAGTAVSKVKYTAASGDTPITTASTGFPGNADLSVDHVILDGQHLLNHPNSYGVHINANNLELIRCTIDGNSQRNINIKGAALREELKITFCNILNSTIYNIIYFGNTDNFTLQKVNISNNNIKFGGGEGCRLSNEVSNITRQIHEIIFSDNVVEGNNNDGFQLRMATGNTTWATYWGYGLIARGNDIFDNGDFTTGTYSSVSDAGGGTVQFNGATAHGAPTGKAIQIDTGPYAGRYKILSQTTSTFTVTHAWVGTDSGTWEYAVGPGNAMRIDGMRHEEARPGWVEGNFLHNNTCGGGQLQTMRCFDIKFSNNHTYQSKSHNDIDEVGIFCDQRNEFCMYDHNFVWNCPGITGVSNSGSGYALWNCRLNAIMFGVVTDVRKSIGFGHANDLDNFYYFMTNYGNTNNNGTSRGISQVGAGAPSSNALHARFNIFSGMDEGINCTINQTDIAANCWHNITTLLAGNQITNTDAVLGDPLITNPNIVPTSGTWTLQSGSPCINTGYGSVALAVGAGTAQLTMTVNKVPLFWASAALGITVDVLVNGTPATIVAHGKTQGQLSGTITFSSPQTWADGAPIQLVEAVGDVGSNGDIGAFAYTTPPPPVGGTIQECRLAHYQANGATSDDVDDAEYEFLLAQGESPRNINDMWVSYLILQGYVGTLNDMRDAYWFAIGCHQ